MTGETKCTSCDDEQCEGKKQRPGEGDNEFLERQTREKRNLRTRKENS